MNIGIIGAGSIVPSFLEAAGVLPQVKLSAIAGRASSAERMHEFAAQYHMEHVYLDYRDMLKNQEIDTIYIALPNHLHYTYAKECLLAGKYVILEKPFTDTVEETMDLIDTAKAQNVYIFEAISNQFFPNYSKCRELLPKLGDIKLVQMNFSQRSSRYDLLKQGIVHPVFDGKKAGGALMDINVYNIHFIVGLFGKPERITYIANIEKAVDTSGILTMQYPHFQCAAIGSKDCTAPEYLTIQGDAGYIYSNTKPNKYESFHYVNKAGLDVEYALNEHPERLYYELETFAKIIEMKDEQTAAQLNKHTLSVMEIVCEARKQVGLL